MFLASFGLPRIEHFTYEYCNVFFWVRFKDKLQGAIAICIASQRRHGRLIPSIKLPSTTWVVVLMLRGLAWLHLIRLSKRSALKKLFTRLSSLELAQHHGCSTAPGGHSTGQWRHSARRPQCQSGRSPGHSLRRWRSPGITRSHSMG